jgi:tRNA nucleotidyltransferase/poly(A) polymerase
MPKKTLFLVGGPVRDFLLNKTIKDYDLATNATPEQIACILHNAEFTMSPERSSSGGTPLNLNFEPTLARSGDKKTWFIKGRDNSPENKVFVISAVVDGEEFEIATFRCDKEVINGQAAVDFVDNPKEDAERRDLTINALYIELTKSDGENRKLYDPTSKGYHDVKHGVVRAVGNAESRFKEDPLRTLRALRFHARFSSEDELDADIEKGINKFRKLDTVALERIRDEFLKGLLNKDVDIKKYITLYVKTGLIENIFPGLNINLDFNLLERLDKPLALAWLLKDNSAEKVANVLSAKRQDKQTGWTIEEKRAVIYLLKMKDFSPEQLINYIKLREGTGLTNEQISKWLKINNIDNPMSKKLITYHKKVKWDDVLTKGLHICKICNGLGCQNCNNGEIKPEFRSGIINGLEILNFTNH